MATIKAGKLHWVEARGIFNMKEEITMAHDRQAPYEKVNKFRYLNLFGNLKNQPNGYKH